MEDREKRDLIECMSKVHDVTKNNARSIESFINAASETVFAIGAFTNAIYSLTDSVDRLSAVLNEEPDEGDEE